MQYILSRYNTQAPGTSASNEQAGSDALMEKMTSGTRCTSRVRALTSPLVFTCNTISENLAFSRALFLVYL